MAFNGFHLGLFDDKDSLDTLLNDKSKLPLVILINLCYYYCCIIIVIIFLSQLVLHKLDIIYNIVISCQIINRIPSKE